MAEKTSRSPHRPVADIVEGGVVALAYHRIEGTHGDPLHLAAAGHVLHHRVVDQTHVQGVGEGDGGLQTAQLLDLHEPRALAEAVEDKGCGGQFVDKGIFLAGEEDGDTGLVIGSGHRAVADGDAGHIGDAVAGALGKGPNGKAVIGRAERNQEQSPPLPLQ